MTIAPAIYVLVEDAIRRHDLPLPLVLAIIVTESGGNPWAYNPEPPYPYLVDVATGRPFRRISAAERRSEVPPPDFDAPPGAPRDAEWWGQQASWGLMQVMGAVAREYGFRSTFLTRLCDPTENLEYGCRHLAALRNRHESEWGWDGVVAAYNAGSPRLAPGVPRRFVNQAYVDKVKANGWG